MKCSTVKVVTDNAHGFRIINEEDFNSNTDELFVEKKKRVTKPKAEVVTEDPVVAEVVTEDPVVAEVPQTKAERKAAKKAAQNK